MRRTRLLRRVLCEGHPDSRIQNPSTQGSLRPQRGLTAATEVVSVQLSGKREASYYTILSVGFGSETQTKLKILNQRCRETEVRSRKAQKSRLSVRVGFLRVRISGSPAPHVLRDVRWTDVDERALGSIDRARYSRRFDIAAPWDRLLVRRVGSYVCWCLLRFERE